MDISRDIRKLGHAYELARHHPRFAMWNIKYGPVTYVTSLFRTSRYCDQVNRSADAAHTGKNDQKIYWHRELPPVDAEPIGEHIIEAASDPVPGTLAHRDELWNECHKELTAHLTRRLEQEMARLGGDYAHVLDESIDSRHDEITGERWLHGQFTYMLYRKPKGYSVAS